MSKEKIKTLLLLRKYNLIRKNRKLTTIEALEYEALLLTMPKN